MKIEFTLGVICFALAISGCREDDTIPSKPIQPAIYHYTTNVITNYNGLSAEIEPCFTCDHLLYKARAKVVYVESSYGSYCRYYCSQHKPNYDKIKTYQFMQLSNNIIHVNDRVSAYYKYQPEAWLEVTNIVNK
jgi:hypothetical protein